MPNTEEIASQLGSMLKKKKFLEAQKTLFAEDAVSLEPEHNKKRSSTGLSAIIQKEQQFLKFVKKWNQLLISDPIISKDYFSISMVTDVTLMNNDRVIIDELIIYHVKDGKIISEQFFYNEV